MASSAAPSPDIFEKLATFYLGRRYDPVGRKLLDDLLLYDAKDLCTHALCVGMTGSGKTGLCLSLLEEAAIDGIPAICIDPKGDLANLMLAFPELRADDFRPWLEAGEASRKGLDLDQFAQHTAKSWKQGLAQWGQTPQRIARFRDAAEVSIFTPGSNIGLPLTVLKSFDAPPAEVINDAEAMGEKVSSSASGLLTLLGKQADPLTSREHILISSILDHCWRSGRSVTVAELIGLISNPPVSRVGVLDLETFMPASDRSALAMMLNNLLASPSFASWLQGETLSIDRLLHAPDGRPRVSILSIAHLSDRERMFFVTILLNELVAWMRTQSGTHSLRAILYMDEVAGYFPPVANPPSKPPMLTLLKQARAFGLGVALATQNPVDLDYKGLSNIGTWFLGRLQTERDKARVLEGLESASTQSGNAFQHSEMDQLLSSLGSRQFLMNNVHEDAPTVFQTRWALSFLAGPLSRHQISHLMADRKESPAAAEGQDPTSATADVASDSPGTRPVIPPGISEGFLLVGESREGQQQAVYRPSLLGSASLHYVRASLALDYWVDVRRRLPCTEGIPSDGWEASEPMDEDEAWDDDPEPGIGFSDLPDELRSATQIKSATRRLKDYLYRHHPVTVYRSPELKQAAPPGLSEQESRAYFRQAARERLDLETEKLREKIAAKVARLESKMVTARQRIDRETEQYEAAQRSWLVSVGSSVLGAFMGRKWASRTNVSRISTAARGASRAAQQKTDIARAEEAFQQLEQEREELEEELLQEIDQLGDRWDVTQIELEAVVIRPRKSDLKVGPPRILWTC